MEPEIVDLQEFLNRMGAKIEGAGSNIIKIEGIERLKDVSYNIMPDRIEAGTLLCAAAITGGEIKLKRVNPNHMLPILDKLTDIGCKITIKENEIELKAPKRLKAQDIRTMPYPGFPTDMQAIISTCLATANGTSVVVENIFEFDEVTPSLSQAIRLKKLEQEGNLTEEKIEKDLDEKVSQKENIINKQTNIYPNEDYIEVEVIYEVLENIGSEDKIIF